jgi:hypothetical protein
MIRFFKKLTSAKQFISETKEGPAVPFTPIEAKLQFQEEVSKGYGKLDIHSDTWLFIKSFCFRRLQELREANDNTTLKETDTLKIRGKIAFIKEILDLSKPAPEINNESEEID